MNWQPIETCPGHPLGLPVLLCIYPVYRCFVGLKCNDGTFVSTTGTGRDGRSITITPSHWMYLPDEPNKQSSNYYGCTAIEIYDDEIRYNGETIYRGKIERDKVDSIVSDYENNRTQNREMSQDDYDNISYHTVGICVHDVDKKTCKYCSNCTKTSEEK